MDLQCVSSLFQVRPAFLRSVDVAEDYDDPRSSEHYVVTNLVRETLQRVSSGLQPASSQRAWRLTGDYGTGKSSFALALARVAAGHDERLPLDLQNWMGERVKLEPILVTGDLEPLRTCILRGISETETRVFGKSDILSSASTNDEVLKLLDRLGDRIRAKKIGDGLLLVLDELGQNLRYAAQHPDDDDVFLLQRLGEKAVRSNGKPLMVLALLHQGFASYSAAADAVAKKEWDKVAGRFEEIVFAQPVEQTAVLLAETLGIQEDLLPKKIHGLMREVMQQAVDCGLYGSLAAKEYLISLAPRLFPLNPVVLPVLIALLRKFGQNERSIVSFLTSFEPFGLRAFADRVSIDGNLYRISDLYDYFKTNLSQLGAGPARARWDIAESVVDKSAGYGETAERLLKSAAILNMIDDPALPSTREILLASESGPESVDTIERLVSELRLLHERGTARGLSLWPHTSANLEELLRQAEEALGGRESHPSALLEYLPEKHLVARRHYVKTGNLRHFSVHYVHAKDAEEALKQAAEQPSGDGTIVVVVPFSLEEQRSAIESTKVQTLPRHVISGISVPVAGISHVLSELKRWEWVRKNARELSFDQFALEYVREEIELLKAALRRELEFLADFVVDRERPIQWFHNGREIQVEEHRGIAGYLSVVCDELYPDCPIVQNELINRRVTSSAASRARTLLIEAVATHSTEECLGFNSDRNPPELAIYLSVLKEGKLHIQDGNSWRFVSYSELDEDPCRLAPSLKCIHDLLLKADLDTVSVDRIYDELRRSPLGVRDGLLPLLVAVYLAGHWEETSVYEDGTFLLKVGGEQFQRLNKEPEMFALQHCSVSGVRLAVYDQLSRAFGADTTQRPDVLTVIRPLVSFAVSLPEYVRHAREVLSPRSRKVRDLLFAARKPATLLFKELPEALGFPMVNTECFSDDQISDLVEGVTEAIAELRNAYPALLCRIRNGLQDAFNSRGDFDEFRSSLAIRSAAIADHIYDLDFKAFVLRLGDSALPDTQWIESVATLVAKKSPERWRNTDEAVFFENLEAFVPRYLRVESIYFDGDVAGGGQSRRCVRLTVTRPDGSEAQEVLNWRPEDDHRLESVKTALRLLIGEHGQIALAAAAGLLWQQQHGAEDEP
ncbi:hypothetical protein [Geobacter benzoatilyticus]|uniref:ATP-binding protein n=1 Tax=Geobacter benzoatilyticus TaxID=2815309 RepID=A0ABX7Q3L7_9BACT|nr:hypothetical protein [Geobacter benzoatilyticus]QSV45483.1 hypothetical protein JZM60_15395 [Geobacter benzoatilyticus]